ncbi:MAG: hypothetical protein H0V09_04950 [Gemmatimonadetes bacterium]|nr:hypothetical protein [Gemmatimonadota bacterium]
MSPGTAEKIGTSCAMTAIMLAWFLGLDIAGVEPGMSLLGWAAVAPFVLYPLLTRVVNSVMRKLEGRQHSAVAGRSNALLNYLRGQTDTSLRTIMDSCDRIKAHAASSDADWRLAQEAATIHYEIMRLQEVISRAAQTAAEAAGADRPETDSDAQAPGPRQDRRAITGYVRRASGLANSSRGA